MCTVQINIIIILQNPWMVTTFPMKTWKALSWTMRAISTDKGPLDYVEIKRQEDEVLTPDTGSFRDSMLAHFKMLKMKNRN